MWAFLSVTLCSQTRHKCCLLWRHFEYLDRKWIVLFIGLKQCFFNAACFETWHKLSAFKQTEVRRTTRTSSKALQFIFFVLNFLNLFLLFIQQLLMYPEIYIQYIQALVLPMSLSSSKLCYVVNEKHEKANVKRLKASETVENEKNRSIAGQSRIGCMRLLWCPDA